MELIILSIAVGIVGGMVSGLLPGVGNLLTMIMLIPVISKWAPLEIFVCFTVLVQVSQFMGSLTTIFTQVPGELSSLPIVQELKNVPNKDLPEVISSTAVGSAVGAGLAITITLILLNWLQWFSYFFRTEILFGLLVIAVVLISKHVTGSFVEKMLLGCAGAILGLVGYNPVIEQNILTFGSVSLMSGLPSSIVLVCLFAFPQLYQIKDLEMLARVDKIRYAVSARILTAMPIASVLGFIGGLMPGLATLLSSQLAYNWAKLKTQDPIYRIAASETANNAGAISQMIPMLILGLPILTSEALALGLMESKGYMPSLVTGIEFLQASVVPLLVSVGISILFAWPLALTTVQFVLLNMRMVRIAAVSLLCLAIFYQAFLDHQMLFVATTFVVLSVIGWFMRQRDTTLMVFLFLVIDRLVETSFRLTQLYF
jgi:putative tricarboxylic transport membrane protein